MVSQNGNLAKHYSLVLYSQLVIANAVYCSLHGNPVPWLLYPCMWLHVAACGIQHLCDHESLKISRVHCKVTSWEAVYLH